MASSIHPSAKKQSSPDMSDTHGNSRATTPPPPNFSDWSWVKVNSSQTGHHQLDVVSLHDAFVASQQDLLDLIDVLSSSAHSSLAAISNHNLLVNPQDHLTHTQLRESTTPKELDKDLSQDNDAEDSGHENHTYLSLADLVLQRMALIQAKQNVSDPQSATTTGIISAMFHAYPELQETTRSSSPVSSITKSAGMGEFNYRHLPQLSIPMEKSTSTPSSLAFSHVSRTTSPVHHAPTFNAISQVPLINTFSQGSAAVVSSHVVQESVAEFEAYCVHRTFAEDILALLDKQRLIDQNGLMMESICNDASSQMNPHPEHIAQDTESNEESYLLPLVKSEIIERDEIIGMSDEIVLSVAATTVSSPVKHESNRFIQCTCDEPSCDPEIPFVHQTQCIQSQPKPCRHVSKRERGRSIRLLNSGSKHMNKKCKRHAASKKISVKAATLLFFQNTISMVQKMTAKDWKELLLTDGEWSMVKILGFAAACSISGFMVVKTGMFLQRGLSYLASFF